MRITKSFLSLLTMSIAQEKKVVLSGLGTFQAERKRSRFTRERVVFITWGN